MLLSSEQIRKIDSAGRRILEYAGVKISEENTLEKLKAAGADVDANGTIVRFTGEWIDSALGRAPSKFTLCSRDGKNDLEMGSGQVYFGNGGRVFQILDQKTGGFRPTLLRDVANTARLVDALDNIRFYVVACQAYDLAPEYYHLNDFFHALNNTGKHVMGGCDTMDGAKQLWDLAVAVAGSAEAFRKRPFVSVITNPISPLTLDNETLKIMAFCGEKGIPFTCAPAPISGATGPATLAGTLAQMHAEAMAGAAIAQTLTPGAKILYGAVPMAMDLRTMDLTMGAVESTMMNTAAVPLAKLCGLPIYASAGVTDAKVPDIQAGFEKGVSCLLLGLSGADYIHLAAGMLDSGNSISYEQYIIDNEILGMVRRVMAGISTDDDSLAADVIENVGPGGNYIMEDHTVRHMFGQFLYPDLAVRMNFDVWAEKGKPTPLTRASEVVGNMLKRDISILGPEKINEIRQRFPEIKGIS